jgi:hypothetical protein
VEPHPGWRPDHRVRPSQWPAEIRRAGTHHRLVRTPFINPYDTRMLPLTYEGLVMLPERRDLPLCGATSRTTPTSSFLRRKHSASRRTMAC